MNDDFHDAALVLVAHGSSVNADSSAPTYRHAGELRRRGLFARVLEAFWKEPPFIRDVTAGLCERRVFVVPLFIGEGYFTQEVIPRELGLASEETPRFPRVLHRPGGLLHYCGPLGTHPCLTEVLLARAREILEERPAPRPVDPAEVTLFLAGHGTGRNENSRRAIDQHVDRIRGRRRYAGVHAIFLEEDPRIDECYRLATTPYLVVVPCFLSDGMHTAQDIPVLLGELPDVVTGRRRLGEWPWRNPTERQGRWVWYTPAIGGEPGIADVILERVREAAASGEPG